MTMSYIGKSLPTHFTKVGNVFLDNGFGIKFFGEIASPPAKSKTKIIAYFLILNIDIISSSNFFPFVFLKVAQIIGLIDFEEEKKLVLEQLRIKPQTYYGA